MAVDRFPVEYSHIMMFARSVGDPNPIYHDPEAAKATEPEGQLLPPRLSSSLRPSSTLTTCCARRSARPGSVPARTPRGSAGFRRWR